MQYDPIIENLHDVLLQLEDDINYQPPAQDETDQQPTAANIMMEDQQLIDANDMMVDCCDEDELEIVTYQ
jgi:hypothetical protein